MINKGEIVLVNFPFTDLSQTKLRPALVLWHSPAGNDVTLCAITSQNWNNVSPDEFVIDDSEAEFASTGLKTTSKVRVTRIATLERRLIVRHLGCLGTQHLKTLNQTMLQAFQLIQ